MSQRWHDIARGIRKTERQRNHISFALYGCQLQTVQRNIGSGVYDVSTLNSTLPSTFSVIGDPRLNEINGLRWFLC